MVKDWFLKALVLAAAVGRTHGDGVGIRSGDERGVERESRSPGGHTGEIDIPELFRRVVHEAVAVERRIESHIHDILPLERRSVPADITPAAVLPSPSSPCAPVDAELRKRQDNAQDQLNSLRQSAQSAIQSVSSSASRAISDMSQSSRIATEQARQSVQQASQSAQQASQSADQARQSADRAVSEARREASQSASQEIAAATRSANSVLSSQMSSLSASAASAIAAASASARNAVETAVNAVQAANEDGNQTTPNTQSSPQPGNLTATQVALIVIGAIVGSSIISVLIFYLFVRRREKTRRKQARGADFRRTIGYPQADMREKDPSSFYDGSVRTAQAIPVSAFPRDVKERPPSPDPPRPLGKYASSVYSDPPISPMSPMQPVPALTRNPSAVSAMNASYAIERKPSVGMDMERKGSVTSNYGMERKGSVTSTYGVERKPVFSSSPYVRQLPVKGTVTLSRPGVPGGGSGMGLGSATNSSASAGPGVGYNAGTSTNALLAIFPRPTEGNGALDKVDEEEAREVSGELKNWLDNGTTVSPFGTLKGEARERRSAGAEKGSIPNWPFDKRGQRKG